MSRRAVVAVLVSLSHPLFGAALLVLGSLRPGVCVPHHVRGHHGFAACLCRPFQATFESVYPLWSLVDKH